MTLCCADGCVVCEVDGSPIDPAWLAERQAADAEGREAVERLLAAPARTAVVLIAPKSVTPAERGATRRAAREAELALETTGVGLTDRVSTGWLDRRQSSTTPGRPGKIHGRRKRIDDFGWRGR